MRKENIYNRPFDESEQIFKKAWQNGDKNNWNMPMTFSQYEKGIQEGRLVIAPHSDMYKDKTIDHRGVTNMDMERDFNAGIVLHHRYSYPVLHNHTYVEIVYVAAGHCVNHFKDSSFEMKQGDICILSPNSLHAVSCTNDESCIINLIVSLKFFDQKFLDILKGGKLVAGFLNDVLYKRASSPYILFHTGQDPWLMELVSRLLTEELQKPYAYDYSIGLLASEFLLHISREYEMMAIVPNVQNDTQNELLVAILGYMSVNYNRTTLAETARFFGYSTAYLSRLIRKNTGKNYNQLITELQMEKATELLRSSKDISLTDIALEIGCFDLSHFNKKFKAIYGVTPRGYLTEPQKNQNRPENRFC